ncbi:hypothetical protein PSTG_12688 [Puccinia striiformis f. sp. tritici PST-78]|uniref:Uncharacterized protein n=1 Tax=Puccinia striiformis f. sp. tritici PST-78 TaxID=1165861 RepID=A0A0L0V3N0_9BASI|nr:hypothetical protein PSTG_12688 [Puccinia striiformis f. sp. tritici PST-78]
MSERNNTNTTHPSYTPPSPDPRFVSTPKFYPPCEKCSTLGLVCGQSTKAAGKGKADKCKQCQVKKIVCKRLPKLVTDKEREVRRKVWTNPKTGETSVYPYTAVESPPQSTPNDKELIELEQETAAPWVTGKKTAEPNTGPSDLSVHSPRFALLQAAQRGKSKRTREQLEEDEILQEVLEEEAAIARLTEAVKNQELVAGPSKRLRLIIASTPDTEEGVNSGRRFENSLENLGGGFLRTNVEGEEFEEAAREGIERGQNEEEEEGEEEGEEEEEEEEYVEDKEQESGPFERETTWKGIATEEEEVLEIDEGFVVAEKEVNLAANEEPEEEDRLFNWSSDDEEEIDVL